MSMLRHGDKRITIGRQENTPELQLCLLDGVSIEILEHEESGRTSRNKSVGKMNVIHRIFMAENSFFLTAAMVVEIYIA